MANTSKVKGEGNYDAAEEYNEAQQEFVKSGKVEKAKREAEPKSDAEAKELEEAEDVGRSHAKEEDPAVQRKSEGQTNRKP
ncbi:MAG: hypothetical protein H0U63_07845 [Burkholderiales bacterium]|nr:hypothetical protein [Burkholderiales bacterium]